MYRENEGMNPRTGYDVSEHKPGGDSYSEWSIGKNSPNYPAVEHTIRATGSILDGVTGQFSNIAIGFNSKYYFRKPSGAIFYGNKYVKTTLASVKYAKFARAAKIGGWAAGTATGIYEVMQGVEQDGGTFGYNAQVQTAGAIGSVAGGIGGAKLGAAVGAGIGAWFGGIGAVPGAILGGLIGGGGGSWAGDYYGEQAAKAMLK